MSDSYTPPQSVRSAAKRGLELRSKSGKGGLTNKEASSQGIGSGIQRARNLSNGDNLTLSTIKRMKAFFDRHEKNKSIAEGKKPEEDAGYVSWLLWGGDPGRSWANKIVSQAEKDESAKKSEKLPGGRADGMSPSDFSENALSEGRDHEAEHTNDPVVAQEIAMDHLAEREDYYEELEDMDMSYVIKASKREKEKKREYNSTPEARAKRAQYNREHGKDKHIKAQYNYRSRHPERYEAQQKARSEEKGRPKKCARCGKPAQHKHHISYGKDASWEWLCHTHHVKTHHPKSDLGKSMYLFKSDSPKTPAEPHERKKGSDKNKKGSASGAENSISLDESTISSLKDKVEAHNRKSEHKVTLGMLKAVWRRGAGAFSSSHRPSQNRASWSMARVNAFLKLVRSGKPDNPKYTTDNDLLPASHKRSNKGEKMDKSISAVSMAAEGVMYTSPSGGPMKKEPRKVKKADCEDEGVPVEKALSYVNKFAKTLNSPFWSSLTYKTPWYRGARTLDAKFSRGEISKADHSTGKEDIAVSLLQHLCKAFPPPPNPEMVVAEPSQLIPMDVGYGVAMQALSAVQVLSTDELRSLTSMGLSPRMVEALKSSTTFTDGALSMGPGIGDNMNKSDDVFGAILDQDVSELRKALNTPKKGESANVSGANFGSPGHKQTVSDGASDKSERFSSESKSGMPSERGEGGSEVIFSSDDPKKGDLGSKHSLVQATGSGEGSSDGLRADQNLDPSMPNDKTPGIVRKGMVSYSSYEDDYIIKSMDEHGCITAEPTLGMPNTPLTSQHVCLNDMCKSTFSAAVTVCPDCGTSATGGAQDFYKGYKGVIVDRDIARSLRPGRVVPVNFGDE